MVYNPCNSFDSSILNYFRFHFEALFAHRL